MSSWLACIQKNVFAADRCESCSLVVVFLLECFIFVKCNLLTNKYFSFLQDSELMEMRQTIELLKKQSIQAGLTSAHLHSMGVQVNGLNNTKSPPHSPSKVLQQQTNGHQKQNEHHTNGNGQLMQRHLSTDSMSSLKSNSSECSSQDKKKKKGWVRFQ